LSTTILIVDDEVELRDAIAFDFRRKKFNVLTASSGREALEIVKVSHVDIVLSDVRMPDGDGLELLDKIKERSPILPVVMFITGFADITIEEAYDRGADAVFAKPFDRKILMEAVLRAIQSPSEQLLRKGSRVEADLLIGAKFTKSNLVVQTRARNIGRGGIFVALDNEFPAVQEEVEFNLESSLEPIIQIKGTGIVRWVRRTPSAELPPGCGIEFTAMDAESISKVVRLVNFLKTRSYIPRR
jgi:CheY-like chemotaxis protein